jgi:hypothetical protein
MKMKKIKNFKDFLLFESFDGDEKFDKYEVENLFKLFLSENQESIELALNMIGSEDYYDVSDKRSGYTLIVNNINNILRCSSITLEELIDLIINHLKVENFSNFSDIDFKMDIPKYRQISSPLIPVRQNKSIGSFEDGSYKFIREINSDNIYIRFSLILFVSENSMDEEINEISIIPEMFFNVGDFNKRIVSGYSKKYKFEGNEFDYDKLLPAVNIAVDKFNEILFDSQLKSDFIKLINFINEQTQDDDDDFEI